MHPSKALLHVAKLLDESRHAAAWGIDFGERDRSRQAARVQEQLVKKNTSGPGSWSRSQGAVLQGTPEIRRRAQPARDAGRGARNASSSSTPSSRPDRRRRFADAESGRPARDGFDAALDLPDIPTSLLVVGGGYIGLELGSVYAALGSDRHGGRDERGCCLGRSRLLVDVLAKRVRQVMKSVRLETKS